MTHDLSTSLEPPAWPGRRVAPGQISVVMQGPVELQALKDQAKRIRQIRRVIPGCEVIVSTWRGSLSLAELEADKVILSDDPGALPGIRRGGQHPNNVNRQIVSSSAGLAASARPYSVKIRNDGDLTHAGFVKLYEQFSGADGLSKIVASPFFTLDPRMFEQLPYHISDWFHFGLTEDVRAMWSAPLMTVEDATYYVGRGFAAHSTYLDRKFTCRLAVEQHIASAFAKRLGLTVPTYHNDIREKVLEDHDTFTARHIIIGDMDQLGFVLPKYDWATRSSFQNLNCITHVDWLATRARVGNGLPTRATARRRHRKAFLRATYKALRPVLPVFYSPKMRTFVNRILAMVR